MFHHQGPVVQNFVSLITLSLSSKFVNYISTSKGKQHTVFFVVEKMCNHISTKNNSVVLILPFEISMKKWYHVCFEAKSGIMEYGIWHIYIDVKYIFGIARQMGHCMGGNFNIHIRRGRLVHLFK